MKNSAKYTFIKNILSAVIISVFTLSLSAQVDFQITLLNPYQDVSCGNASDSVYINIQNTSGGPLDSIPFGAIINGSPQPVDTLFQSLINNASDDTLAAYLNMSAGGQYNIQVFTAYDGLVNDTIYDTLYVQQTALTVPYLETFEDRDNVQFFYFGDSTLYSFDTGNEWLRFNNGSVVVNDSLTSPKIDIDGNNYHLGYSYTPLALGAGDTILIQLSSDCDNYNTIDSIFNGRAAEFILGEYYSLSAYDGSDLTVRFVFINAGGYTFDLTELEIRHGVDVGVDSVYTKYTCKGDPSDEITVRIENYGISAVSGFEVEVQVYDPITDLTSVYQNTYTATLNPPSAVGAGDGQQGVLIVGTHNTFALTNDNYEITGYTLAANDADTSNDEIATPLTTNFVGPNSVDSLPLIYIFAADAEGWDVSDNANYSAANNGTINSNLINIIGESATMVSPLLDNITSNTRMIFYYWLESSGTSDILGLQDTIRVQVSDDCMETWTDVEVISSTEHVDTSIFMPYEVDLGTYSGERIYVRISVEKDAGVPANITLHIDKIKLIDVADYDLATIAVDNSETLCGVADDYVDVDIACYSLESPTTIPVYLTVTDPDANENVLVQNVTGPLGFNDTVTVRFSGINTLTSGAYTYSASTEVALDNIQDNDTLGGGKTYYDPETTLNEDFNAALSAAWELDGMDRIPSYLRNPFAIAAGDTVSAITPEIGPIGVNDYLTYDYSLETNGGSDTLGDGDEVLIQISLDCGLNYTTLAAIDTNTHEPVGGFVYTTDTIDLAPYVGELVYFRIIAGKDTISSSTANFDVRIDNLVIKEIWDVEVTEVDILETGTCWQADDTIQVKVTNNTPRTISDIPLNFEIELLNSVYYEDDTVEIDTIIPSIVYRDTVTINFVINSRPDGDYTFTATTELDDDSNTGNDSDNASKSIDPVIPIPYSKSSGFDGTDEWSKDMNITGTTSLIETNSLGDGDSAIVTSVVIGPVPADNYLLFDYLIESDAGNGYQIGEGDFIEIFISTDCRETYSSAGLIDASNHDYSGDILRYALDLSAYEDEEISIQIVAYKVDDPSAITNNFNVYIDSIEINTGIDVGVTDITVTSDTCATTSNTVTVEVTNYSAVSQSNVDVELSVTRPNGTTITLEGTVTGPIAMLETGEVVFSSGISTADSGEYQFDAITILAGDLESANDLYSDFSGGTEDIEIFYVNPLPFIETFSDFDDENWQGDNTFDLDGGAYVSDTILTGGESSVITPPIGAITASSNLVFDYMIVSRNLSNQWGYSLGLGDTIFIMVSSDCKATWDEVGTIVSTNHTASDEFEEVSVDLSAYAGSNIMIQFLATKNIVVGYTTNRYAISIDDIKVTDEPDYDYGVTEIIESPSLCGSLTDSLQVIVTNLGSDIFLGNLDIILKITNPYGTKSTKTKTVSANIASGASSTATFTVNTSILEGTGYSFEAYTVLAEDNLNENDTSAYAETFFTTDQSLMENFNVLPLSNQWDTYNFSVGGGIAFTDTLLEDSMAYIRTPRLGPLAENSYLSVDYLIKTDQGNDIGPGDEIIVQVSNDCGLTWVGTDTLNSDNYTPSATYTTTLISLLDFAGEEVYVNIIASKSANGASTTDSLKLSIDNVFIDTIYDVDINEIILSELICGSAAEPVQVVVENVTPIAIADVPIDLEIEYEGVYIETLSTTISSLDVDEIDTVLFTLDATEDGEYTFKAKVLLDGDSDGLDSLEVKQMYNEPFEIPYSKTTNFNDGEWSGINLSNDTTASITTANLMADTTGSIISPRIVVPASGAQFMFEYKTVSDHSSGKPNILGKGDTIKVQVTSDCAASYTTLYKIDASNKINQEYIVDSIDLMSYANQTIALRFLAEKDSVAGSATSFYSLQIDSVFINNGQDAGVTDIIISRNDCGFESNLIGIEVENFGNVTINKIPVRLVINDEVELVDTITTALPGREKDTIEIAVVADTVGDYEFDAYIELAADLDKSNDTTSGVTNTIAPTTMAPVFEPFDGNTNIEEWDYVAATNNNMAITSILSAGDTAILRSPHIGPLVANDSVLSFNYLLTALDGSNNLIDYLMDKGDSINVQVSSDCGNTYTTVYSINSTNHPDAEGDTLMASVDISSYVGDEIFVRIFVKNVLLSGDKRARIRVLVDNFAIYNGIDVGITEIIRNADVPTCGFENDPVELEITNFGALDVSNIPIQVDVYGTIDTSISVAYSGTLAVGEIDTIMVGDINTIMDGTYEIIAKTMLTADKLKFNNDAELVVEIDTVIAVPLQELTNNFTTAYWNFDQASIAGANIATSMITPDDSAFIILNKVGPIQESSYLVFDQLERYQIPTPNRGLLDDNKVLVQVSQDCGYTYETIHVIDTSNDNETALFETIDGISLEDYVGENINIRIALYVDEFTDASFIQLQIDNVKIIQHDAGVSLITHTSSSTCGDVADSIEITINNYSSVPIDDIPYVVEVTAADFNDYMIIDTLVGTLEAGDDTTFYVDDFNSTVPQDYYIDAYTTLMNDGDESNDEQFITFNIPDLTEVPDTNDFETPGGTLSNFVSESITFMGNVTFGDFDIISSRLTSGDTAEFTTYRYTGIDGHYLLFDYLVNAYDEFGAPIGNHLRRSDTIYIQASTDCGDTYTTLATINNGNHEITDTTQEFYVDLSGFNVDDEVLFRVMAVKGVIGEMDVTVDNFSIITGPDVQLIAIEDPENRICGSASEELMVVVKNSGLVDVANFPISVAVNHNNNPNEQIVTVTYSDTLSVKEEDTVIISPINMTAVGTYDLSAYTDLDDDNERGNDTLETQITIKVINQLPYNPTLTAGLVADWDTVNVNATGAGLVTNLLQNGDTAVITSAKVGPVSANNNIYFEYLINTYNYNSGAPTLIGNYLRASDSIEVQVSGDCGETFTVIHTINSTNHVNSDEDSALVIPLAGTGFEGQIISVRIKAYKGAIGAYTLQIDNFDITIPDEDVMVAEVILAQSKCGVEGDSVWVSVMNASPVAEVSNIPIQVDVEYIEFADSLYETFDPIYNANWAVNNGVVTNVYGSVSGDALVVYGDNWPPNLQTTDIDVTEGGTIKYSAYCPNTSIALYYSTNSGASWTWFSGIGWNNWTNYSIAIPAGAQTTSTRFAWHGQNSGQLYSIDNINIPLTTSTLTVGTEVKESITGVFTDTVKPGDLDTLFLGLFDSRIPGTYNLAGYTKYLNDIDNSNDTATLSKTVLELVELPYQETFASYPGGWEDENMSTIVAGYIRSATLSPATTTDSAVLISPKFTAIDDNMFLSFDYLIASGSMTYGDTIFVQVSEDCGLTYIGLDTITNTSNVVQSNTEWYAIIKSLDQFIESEIIVRIVAIKENTGTYQLAIDNFTISKPNIDIFSIMDEFDGMCGKTDEQLTIIVQNNGITPVATVPIRTHVDLIDFTTLDFVNRQEILDTLSDTLDVGESDTIFVEGVDMTEPGTYEIQAILEVSGNSSNTWFPSATSSVDVVVQDIIEIPYAQMLNNTTNPTDPSEYWILSDNVIHQGKRFISDPVYETEEALITSPKLTGFKANTYVIFDIWLESGAIEPNDNMLVLATTDCGAIYDTLGAITELENEFGYNDTNTVSFSLAAYEGMDIFIKIALTKNDPGSVEFGIDNIMFDYGDDVGILEIVNDYTNFIDRINNNLDNYTPSASFAYDGIERYRTCGLAADSIYVLIQNAGYNTVSDIPISVDVSGNVNVTFDTTYAGPIEPEELALVYIGTISTVTPGLRNIEAYTELATDNQDDNDTLNFSVTTQRVYGLSYYAFDQDVSGHFNESSFWVYDKTGNMAYSGGTNDIRANGLVPGDTAYAISPKVGEILATSYLVFNYSLTNTLEQHIVSGEKFEVLVSDDCGTVFDLIQTISVNTSDLAAGNKLKLSLANYSGENIRIMFRAIKGKSNGNFNVTISNIEVRESLPENESITVCNSQITSHTTSIGTTSSYRWKLIPGTTGTIIGTGSTVRIDWTNDYEGEAALLTYAISNIGAVTATSDTIEVTIEDCNDGTDIDPESIVICNGKTTSHTAIPVTGAVTYLWDISPKNAGVIVSNTGLTVQIQWNKKVYGDVEVYVRALDGSGTVIKNYQLLNVILDACLVGIDDSENGIMNVYPNPTSGIVFIEMAGEIGGLVELSLIDIDGRVVIYEKLEYAPSYEINLSDISQGIYLLELRSEAGIFRERVVIE
ncbi:T9SS type A sorting domain-containing protein [Bacteroidota bacterium]